RGRAEEEARDETGQPYDGERNAFHVHVGSGMGRPLKPSPVIQVAGISGYLYHDNNQGASEACTEHQMVDVRFQRELVELVPRLRRFAYALTGSSDAGDDLVQAACERALRNAEQFRPGTRMDSWMFRIMQNL